MRLGSWVLLASLCLGASVVCAAEPEASAAPGSEITAVVAVNLNEASEAELVRLPGIGPSRARAIIAYRDRRPFKRPEEILKVHGIGRKTFRKLRPHLTVGPPRPAQADGKT